MMITSTPPHVAISVGAREGQAKDTLRNIRETGTQVRKHSAPWSGRRWR
jgi:hypothetical protein